MVSPTALKTLSTSENVTKQELMEHGANGATMYLHNRVTILSLCCNSVRYKVLILTNLDFKSWPVALIGNEGKILSIVEYFYLYKYVSREIFIVTL